MPQAYATDADLLALDPCNSTPGPTRDVFRGMAQTMLPALELLGARASYAHALLTLHLLASNGVSGTSSSAGAVASASIGSLSVSYTASAGGGTGPNGSTGWGALYDMILDGLPVLGVVGRSEGPLLLGLTSRPRFR